MNELTHFSHLVFVFPLLPPPDAVGNGDTHDHSERITNHVASKVAPTESESRDCEKRRRR